MPTIITKGGASAKAFGFGGGAGGIGIPTSLGDNVSAAGISSFTTTGAIVAGNLVVVAFAGNSASASAVSDGVNSYTKAKYIQNSSSYNSYELWYCANASAVASGATLTWGGGYMVGISMAQVSGVSLISPYDSSAAASGVANGTTTITVTTGTLSNSVEIIFAGNCLDTNSTAHQFVEDATFTNLSYRQASYSGITLGYKIVASTSAIPYSPTFSPSGNYWATVVAPFKGA
jgi:hypothetical protein